MNKNNRYINYLYITLISLSFAFTACQKKEETASRPMTAKEQLVSTIELRASELSTSTRLTGTVRADVSGSVSSPIDGTIEKLLVRENSFCKRGDLVALISSNDRTALIASHQLKVLELERKIARTTGTEKEGLEKSLRETRRKQETALSMYQPYPVFSAMNGMVTQRFLDKGAYVLARQPILTLSDMNSLVVSFEVSESYFSSIQDNSLFQLRFNAYPDLEVKGRLVLIHPQVDTKSRSLRIDIKPIDFQERILLGMMVEMDLPLRRKAGVIAVPGTAILTRPNEDKVVFVVEDDHARERKIVTGMVSGDLIEIVSGLKEGDQLVIQGHQGLKDGIGVKILPAGKAGKVNS